jgi:AraC-like DNA-binding protein
MNSKPSFEPHLSVSTVVLQPGAEWHFPASGWSLVLVSSGVAYWLNPQLNHELPLGSAILLWERAKGMIRASQVGPVVICYVRMNPNRLGGLMTWGEQQALGTAASREHYPVRTFSPQSPVAEKLKEICARPEAALPVRLKLLELFIDAIGSKVWEGKPGPSEALDARTRLIKILNETPVSDLLELSFSDLVVRARCTPRHLSRIFHDVVGMSYRQKQAQLRLVRAQELLATTESKVVEVALESGYQSLSLFNLMFKRHFGLTPAKWRSQSTRVKRHGRVALRVRFS